MQVVMEVDAVHAEKKSSEKYDNEVQMCTGQDVPHLSTRESLPISIPMNITSNVDTNVNYNITLQDISSPKSSSKVNLENFTVLNMASKS